MKLEFYSELELNNNYLCSFGHKEIAALFVCLFCSNMRANNRLPNCFSMCLDSDKKILPLIIIAMSSRRIRDKYHQLVFSEI